jgi:hypothetical protein
MANNSTWIFIGIGALALLLLFTGHLKLTGTVNLQSVLQPGQVSFRTNLNAGNMWGSLLSWVALDGNDDGVLESYTQYGNPGSCPPANGPYGTVRLYGTTPSGTGGSYQVYVTSQNYVFICKVSPDADPGYIFYGASPNAVLSTSPTAPYTANNQELLVGGTITCNAATLKTTASTAISTWVTSGTAANKVAAGNAISAWAQC